MLLSSAELTKDWSYTSTTIYLHSAHREKLVVVVMAVLGRLTICNARFEVYTAILMRIQLKCSSNLKTRAVRSFERQETTNPAAQSHIPDDLRHQQNTCLVGTL
jgi:hypothetical protein